MWRNEVSPLHRGSVEGILTRRWRARGRHYWQINRIWRRPLRCLCIQNTVTLLQVSLLSGLRSEISLSSAPFHFISLLFTLTLRQFVRRNFSSCAGNSQWWSVCHKASMCSAHYFFYCVWILHGPFTGKRLLLLPVSLCRVPKLHEKVSLLL